MKTKNNKNFRTGMVLFLAVILCLGSITVLADSPNGVASAASGSSESIDLTNAFNTTSNGTGGYNAVTFPEPNVISFGNENIIPRTDFVSVSKYSVDFTRSFTLSGLLDNTVTADGFTITFQTDKNYSYVSGETASGSGLCVYGVQEAKTSGRYAKQALVTEVDTYESSEFGLDGNQLAGFIKGVDPSKSIPHLAITTTDGTSVDGKSYDETIHDAAAVTTGSTYAVDIDWKITDAAKGTGTYTVTYRDTVKGGTDVTLVYENFNPNELFGANASKTYLTFTGSVDLNENNGVPFSTEPWNFTFNYFRYNDEDFDQSIEYYVMKQGSDGTLVRDYQVDSVSSFAEPSDTVRAYYKVNNKISTGNIATEFTIPKLTLPQGAWVDEDSMHIARLDGEGNPIDPTKLNYSDGKWDINVPAGSGEICVYFDIHIGNEVEGGSLITSNQKLGSEGMSQLISNDYSFMIGDSDNKEGNLAQSIEYYVMKRSDDGTLIRDYRVDNVSRFAKPSDTVRAYYRVSNRVSTEDITAEFTIPKLTLPSVVWVDKDSMRVAELDGRGNPIAPTKLNYSDGMWNITVPAESKSVYVYFDIYIGNEVADGSLVTSNQRVFSDGIGQFISNDYSFMISVPKIEPVKVNLQALKRVNGETPSDKQKYTFNLIDENGTVLQSKTNSGENIYLDDLIFNSVGTYKYTLVEENAGDKNTVYDMCIYTVEIRVNKIAGELYASVSYKKDGAPYTGIPEFNNVYNAKKPKLAVTQKRNRGVTVKKGQIITYKITIKNKGDGDATGIRVRDYVPEYCLFYSVKSPGKYGVIKEKEHATWFIKTLKAGKSTTLTFKVRANYCIPKNFKPKNVVFYEITGDTVAPPTNTAKNPANSIKK